MSVVSSSFHDACAHVNALAPMLKCAARHALHAHAHLRARMHSQVSSTAYNEDSSRSHTICRLHIDSMEVPAAGASPQQVQSLCSGWCVCDCGLGTGLRCVYDSI